MADEADNAAELEALQRQIAVTRKKMEAPPHYTGACYYCQTPVQPPRRWCDADCAQDWENDKIMRK